MRLLSEPGQGTTASVFPDVFARVSLFINWITRTVCREVPGDEVFCQGPRAKASKQTKQAKAGLKESRSKAHVRASSSSVFSAFDLSYAVAEKLSCERHWILVWGNLSHTCHFVCANIISFGHLHCSWVHVAVLMQILYWNWKKIQSTLKNKYIFLYQFCTLNQSDAQGFNYAMFLPVLASFWEQEMLLLFFINHMGVIVCPIPCRHMKCK